MECIKQGAPAVEGALTDPKGVSAEVRGVGGELGMARTVGL